MQLHESKLRFVLGIEFIRSKLSNFLAHVSRVNDSKIVLVFYQPIAKSSKKLPTTEEKEVNKLIHHCIHDGNWIHVIKYR